MAVIRANPGLFTYRNSKGGGSFVPEAGAKLYVVGQNPESWRSTGADTLAARLLVGFNVGIHPTWKLDDVVRIVKRVRRKKPGASFVLQRGLYRHRRKIKGKRRLVEEDGVQLIIVDLWATPQQRWEAQTISLAETLARELKQEEVVVEIQRGGVTQNVIGVTP